mgnify:CR=1 FL=1
MAAKQIVLNNSYFTNYIDTFVNPSDKQLKEWKEIHYKGNEEQKYEERWRGKDFGTYDWVLCDIYMGHAAWSCVSTTKPFYKWLLKCEYDVLHKNRN